MPPLTAKPSASLVISTLGRTTALQDLFASLQRQTFTDFEVILIDQNDDERLTEMLQGSVYSFPLRHMRRPGERGLSRGRNAGWRLAEGDTIIFPDDDCWYPENFLQTAITLMNDLGCDVISGRAADHTGRSINGRYETTRQVISRPNIWTTQIEWVVMFRREVLEAIGGYDEGIGIGADTAWQSGEGQDIMLRALARGFKCVFDPDLVGHHLELNVARPDNAMCRKGRIYGRGMGHVLRHHKFRVTQRLRWIARPLGGALLNLPRNSARSRYLLWVAAGRAEGLMGRALD
jgi:glycosyltransferase involved in cell wall biosynthesis